MSRKPQEQFDEEVSRAAARLPEARRQLSHIPGVVDVQVGIKETGGLATDEVVFHVFVQRKKPLRDLPPEQRVPPSVGEFRTDVIATDDHVPEDILSGGRRVTQSLWGTSFGTLGAFALTTTPTSDAPPGTPVLLTNQHVAEDVGDLVGIDCLCDSWCCECCDVGRVVKAQLSNQVDAAIATLSAGVRFTHEILGIGAIRGSGAAAMGNPILKYGHTTGLTNGTVTSITSTVNRTDGANFINQIRVAPAPPSTDMSEGGDSGSAYVNGNTRQIVGLHHAGGGPTSDGNHIGPVMAAMNISFPVMGTAGAIPIDVALAVDRQPTMFDAIAALRGDLERTAAGQRWLALLREHSSEVRFLVNHHRETKVAWQRSQGPGFIAHYVKSARERTHRVPREIGGVHIQNAIIAMASVLQRHGSPALAQAISEHYLNVLQCAERSESAEELITHARRLAEA
jgi:hypothetical protein